MIERGWGLRPVPFFALGRARPSRRKTPDKTYQNKPVPFWQVGGDAYDQAVLFDMDGVLVDTEWFYNRRRVAFMEEKGFHFDEIPDLSGSNEPAIWEALVPDDIELRERLRVEYKQVYSPDHPVPYTELLNEQTGPVMRELHERGVKCAIASSSYRELIDELVGIAGIATCWTTPSAVTSAARLSPTPRSTCAPWRRWGWSLPSAWLSRTRLWASRPANAPRPRPGAASARGRQPGPVRRRHHHRQPDRHPTCHLGTGLFWQVLSGKRRIRREGTALFTAFFF